MSFPVIIFAYLGLSFLALVILQIAYIAVMGLQRARDENKLAPWAIKAGEAFAALGLVWDVLCNILIASVIFLEVPREATVSQRLRRLVMLPTGWRKDLATWFAINNLNPFSNYGPHIPLPT